MGASFRDCWVWVLGTTRLPDSGTGMVSMRDMARAPRGCWGVLLCTVVWGDHPAETLSPTPGHGAQAGDSTLVAVSVCWLVVRGSLLMVVGVSVGVRVTVSLQGGDKAGRGPGGGDRVIPCALLHVKPRRSAVHISVLSRELTLMNS